LWIINHDIILLLWWIFIILLYFSSPSSPFILLFSWWNWMWWWVWFCYCFSFTRFCSRLKSSKLKAFSTCIHGKLFSHFRSVSTQWTVVVVVEKICLLYYVLWAVEKHFSNNLPWIEGGESSEIKLSLFSHQKQ
jgi:hypothetical protein